MNTKNILVFCCALLSTNFIVSSHADTGNDSCWKSFICCCFKKSAEQIQTHDDYVTLCHEPHRTMQPGVFYEDNKGGSFIYNPMKKPIKNIHPIYKNPTYPLSE